MAPRLRALTAASFLLIAATPELARAQPYFEAPLDLSADTHWTNYLRIADLTGDGHLDVIVANCGGFFSTPQAQPFQVFVNNGSGAFTDGTAATLGAFSQSVRQFALGDVNGDGALDLYVPDAGGAAPDRLFISQGGGKLANEAAARLPAGLSSSAGAARFGDFDGDGDLDLIVLDGYPSALPDSATLYLNDGTGKFAAAPGALPAISSGSDPDDVDLADFDRDFDLDVFVNMHEGKSLLWLNDGSGKLSDATANVPGFNTGFHYGPGVCDVDGDADIDVWVDNVHSPYAEMLLINDGTGKLANETAARVTDNPTSADDNGVACVDIDDDGDLDAAIMSLSANERILINDGTGKFQHVGGFPSVSDPTLWFDFGDLNGDGRLDCVTGQGEGSPRINRIYPGASSAPVDSKPPRILITEVPAVTGGEPVVRFAVSDNAVTDDGPRLTRAFVRITKPATAEHDARFVGGDLFRAQLPAQPAGTTVEYQACATDLRNNEGCGGAQSYVASGGGAGGSSGSSGSAGAGAGGSAGSAAGGASGSGAASSGGTGGSAASGGSPATGGGSSDGGCGCRIGEGDGTRGLWAALALVLAALRRRRRG